MKFSPFVILCCRQAASANPPPEPPGHPLVLSEDAQRGLYEESRLLARSTKVVIDAQGGGKVTLAIPAARSFRCAVDAALRPSGRSRDRGSGGEGGTIHRRALTQLECAFVDAWGVETKAPKGVLNPLPDRSIARAKQTVSYPAPRSVRRRKVRAAKLVADGLWVDLRRGKYDLIRQLRVGAPDADHVSCLPAGPTLAFAAGLAGVGSPRAPGSSRQRCGRCTGLDGVLCALRGGRSMQRPLRAVDDGQGADLSRRPAARLPATRALPRHFRRHRRRRGPSAAGGHSRTGPVPRRPRRLAVDRLRPARPRPPAGAAVPRHRPARHNRAAGRCRRRVRDGDRALARLAAARLPRHGRSLDRPGPSDAQYRAVIRNPTPCSSSASSLALSRRRASNENSSDPMSPRRRSRTSRQTRL